MEHLSCRRSTFTFLAPSRRASCPHRTVPRVSPNQRFAANVRSGREQRGLSQEALAALGGLHRTEISLIERSEREPRLSTIIRLAQALDVAPAELLKDIAPTAKATLAHPRLGANVAAARDALGLTVEQLAERAGLTRTELDRLERGGEDPRLSALLRLALALERSLAELLEGVG